MYDALIAKWPEIPGDTDEERLAAVNALTITGPAVPMVIPTYRIYNLLDAAEFVALTEENKGYIRDILSMGTVDTSPDTQARNVIANIFATSPLTIANLSALAAEYDSPSIPWWSAPVAQGGGGLTSPVSMTDLEAAGLKEVLSGEV